jgi:glutamine synthetase
LGFTSFRLVPRYQVGSAKQLTPRHLAVMSPSSATRRLRALGHALGHGAADSTALVTAAPAAADSPEAVQIAGMGDALGIEFYLFCFTDLFGVLRSKLVPASAVRTIATDGAGFAGFAAWMDMSPADGDVLCLPDPSSFTQLPWKKEVAWLACNPHHGVNSRHDGEEIDQAPRNVLRAQMAKFEAMGLELKTGVELEFFLLDADDTSQLSDPTDTAAKPCYDQAALMKRYDFIAELVSAMEALGWGPYQADHEDGNGQFEINWEFDNALVTADRHAFAKYMTKSIAEKHGYVASYMPKPFVDRAGSGLHAHITLHDETGANVFKEAGAGEYEVSPLGWCGGGQPTPCLVAIHPLPYEKRSFAKTGSGYI